MPKNTTCVLGFPFLSTSKPHFLFDNSCKAAYRRAWSWATKKIEPKTKPVCWEIGLHCEYKDRRAGGREKMCFEKECYRLSLDRRRSSHSFYHTKQHKVKVKRFSDRILVNLIIFFPTSVKKTKKLCFPLFTKSLFNLFISDNVAMLIYSDEVQQKHGARCWSRCRFCVLAEPLWAQQLVGSPNRWKGIKLGSGEESGASG